MLAINSRARIGTRRVEDVIFIRKLGLKPHHKLDGFIFTSIASATKYVKVVEC